MDNGQRALALAEQAVNQALSHIKQQCLDGDRLSGKKLDEHQLVSYEIAFCAAELAGAKHALEYAERAQAAGDGQLETDLALAFCGEALQSIANRLTGRASEFGLDETALSSTIESTDFRSFCREQNSAANLAKLGETIQQRHGRLGAYLLDEEKEMFRESFRRFAEDVVMPLAEHIHRDDLDIPDEIIEPLTDMGVFGLSIPERFGGIQPDDREDSLGMIVVTEELSRGSLGAAGSLITRPEIFARALLKGGTPEQQEHWLPKLANADPLCGICITEPNYGSDVANMKLKATKVDGGWLLDGAKTWCTFGGRAGVLLTLARTNPDPKLGHRGLSQFIVEKPSFPGHSFEHTQEDGGTIRGKAISTIGYRGMHSFDVFFDSYFVPDSHLLGGPEGEGQGFYFTMAGFSGGRIQTAARASGLMEAAFEKAVEYAEQRKVFGQPIGEYQLTQIKLAKMAAMLTACRQFTYEVGRQLDRGEGQMEASLVKLYACKATEWVTREALQIHGGMGYAEETAVSRFWLDARVLSIFEGAEETLALKVIARALIEAA